MKGLAMPARSRRALHLAFASALVRREARMTPALAGAVDARVVRGARRLRARDLAGRRNDRAPRLVGGLHRERDATTYAAGSRPSSSRASAARLGMRRRCACRRTSATRRTSRSRSRRRDDRVLHVGRMPLRVELEREADGEHAEQRRELDDRVERDRRRVLERVADGVTDDASPRAASCPSRAARSRRSSSRCPRRRRRSP